MVQRIVTSGHTIAELALQHPTRRFDPEFWEHCEQRGWPVWLVHEYWAACNLVARFIANRYDPLQFDDYLMTALVKGTDRAQDVNSRLPTQPYGVMVRELLRLTLGELRATNSLRRTGEVRDADDVLTDEELRQIDGLLGVQVDVDPMEWLAIAGGLSDLQQAICHEVLSLPTADPTRWFIPSAAHLGRQIGVSRNSVSRALGDLKARGVLQVVGNLSKASETRSACRSVGRLHWRNGPGAPDYVACRSVPFADEDLLRLRGLIPGYALARLKAGLRAADLRQHRESVLRSGEL